MLSHSKLATKFTWLLSLVFIGGILMGGLALSKALQQKAEAEVSYRGQVLMQVVNSVGTYTTDRIAPLLASEVETQSDFIPETIPSFAAREVFEIVRQNPEYKNLFYKDAILNPTNLANRADPFETDLIERFQDDKGLKTLSGFRTMYGEELFYSAQPIVITNPSCLSCHSTPDVAPKSHVETYGTENGFGWTLNEVLGTRVIYIPASEVFENAHQALFLVIGIFIGIFALVILVINYLLKRNVIQPIKPLAQLAEKISMNAVSYAEAEEFERRGLSTIAKRTDELGQLGRVFKRMVYEIYDREQRLAQQLKDLRVEVDEAKRERQVAEIADATYFKRLSEEAKDIRNKWSENSEKN